MAKLDLKALYKPFYNPPRRITDVEVPELGFLAIDGAGRPESDAFAQAVGTLYAVSYTLKFQVKKDLGIEYPVMPLEALWWADDMGAFSAGARDQWQWTAMILQPDLVTAELVASAGAAAAAKRDLPALPQLRLWRFTEGPAAQVMYVGPYAEEAPTIAAIHRHIEAAGHALSGRHHEIYLGDPRRSAPEKLRTVIRQPYS